MSVCFPRFFQSQKTLQIHWEAVWMEDISTPGLCASLEQVLELSDYTVLADSDVGVDFFLLRFTLLETEANTVHLVTLWLCGVCGLFVFPRLGIFKTRWIRILSPLTYGINVIFWSFSALLSAPHPFSGCKTHFSFRGLEGQCNRKVTARCLDDSFLLSNKFPNLEIRMGRSTTDSFRSPLRLQLIFMKSGDSVGMHWINIFFFWQSPFGQLEEVLISRVSEMKMITAFWRTGEWKCYVTQITWICK